MAMMNRRGMVRAHSHWRPQRRATQRAAPGRRNARMGLHRAGIGVVVLAAVAVVAVATVASRGSARGGSALPATPMAWLDAFSAGVARDDGDVCSRLLSSEFRAAMQRDAHESCAAYYRSAQVLSVRVLRILRLGETAAIEIRYFPRGGYSTFVLDRLARGWQGVAIVPGGPLPIA